MQQGEGPGETTHSPRWELQGGVREALAGPITHVQLPQQQLNLVLVLEVGVVLLVQVRVHLVQQVLGILHVFVELAGRPDGPITDRK